MPTKMIEGDVIDIGIDPRDQELESLRAEIRRLQRALNDANVRADRAQEDAQRALSMLRKQLNPLYRALQAVFGELDTAGVTEEAPQAAAPAAATAPDVRVSAVWQAWKSKLGTGPGKVIDALLLHGEMTAQQIAIATGYHRNSIPDLIYRLNKAGLINKNGGRFSLKSLG